MTETKADRPTTPEKGRPEPGPDRRAPPPAEGQITPLRLWLTTLLAIFLSEILVILAMRKMNFHSPYAEAIWAGALLGVLAVPVLYSALFHPMIRYIARLQRMESTLRELAIVDEMTDLLNRRGFATLGEEHLKLARRLKKGLACLFIDLNGLKRINDTLGHAQGDAALTEAAGILKETFRESDVIARMGGDEFVVLALETGAPGTDKLLARLDERISAANAQVGRRYELSLCIGVVRSEPGQEISIEQLVSRADAAMYEKKLATHRART
jgi:diguanylate cyclase (GGDEF)-like protein